jgi:hypothetical protein
MLQPEAKHSNIETSLTVWLRAQLVTGAGLTMFLPDEPPTPRPAQWVHVDYLLGLRHEFGGTVGSRFGGVAHGLLQLSLCVKRDAITNLYAMARLHDTVMAFLQPGQAIPLRDFGTSGGPLLGHIEVGGTTVTAADDGATSGVVVEVLSVEIEHSTAWTLV